MEYKEGSALAGVRVVDAGIVISGPFAASLLADMGAEVIKVEMPVKGDNSRENLPMKDGESTYYMNFNRSKKGVTLDLKKGKELFFKLLSKADVFIENFRPGVMERLGYGYEAIKAVNPGIIYVSISGFGQNGPYRHRAGYDPLAQAMSGIMSVTGYPDSPPVRAGASIADIMAGQNAAIGILAALHHREKTGQGQYIDISLLDSAIVGLSSVMQVHLTDSSVIPARRGNGYVAGAPGGAYLCKDGYVVCLALGEKAWLKLAAVMEREDLLKSEKYLTNELRVGHYQELDQEVEKWTRSRSVEEVVFLLNEAGLPAAPILSIQQVCQDTHICGDRQMFTTIRHPKVGEIKITNQAIKMSETSPFVRASSPMLGQHNQEVYRELGFTEGDIRNFHENKII